MRGAEEAFDAAVCVPEWLEGPGGGEEREPGRRRETWLSSEEERAFFPF